jgi:hypothetical protein
MKRNVTLTVTALLTVLLSSFHLADDVVRGFEPGGTQNYIGIVIVAVFLYAVLALAETRIGLILIMLGSIGGSGVPYIHMIGRGLVGPKGVSASGVFFWVWTNLALGAVAIVTAVLAAQQLWRSFRPPQRTV